MRTKRIMQNFLSDVLPQVLIAFLGIFKIKILLNYIGEEQLGLYQLFSQIIPYIVLIEGGAAMAILFRLYKPFADKDQEQINIIASTGRVVFRVMALLIMIIGAIVAYNIGFFINPETTTISINVIRIAFFIFLLSQTMLYFVITERNIFDADQKRYVPNLIYQTSTIIKSIIEIVIVLFGGELIQIVTGVLIVNIIANIIMYIAFKKTYPNIKFDSKKDYSVLKDVRHLFVNTIGNLVTNNIDIIIISKYIDLTSVVIYTAYNYIVNSIIQIIEKITGSTLSSVADLIVKEKNRSYEIFMEYNSFLFYIAAIICTPLLFSINPFINIWYQHQIVTSNILALLFCSILFYQIIRIPLKTFTFASGMFEKVKKYVIVECIVNITLSLLLVNKLGIAGILLATLVAFITCDYVPKSRIIFKEIIEQPVSKYYISNMKYIVLSIGTMYLVSLIHVNMNNLFMWALYSALVFMINFILVTIVFYLNKDLKFINRLNLNRFIKPKEKI